jgi:predicted transcriptional regulator of viral defense system
MLDLIHSAKMSSKTEPIELKPLGVVTSGMVLKKLRISQPTLSRWVKNGEIRRLSHGLYVHPEFNIPPEDLDFVIACARFGRKSAIGGLSALFHYGLIDQPPSQVWVVVPPNKADSNQLYRRIRTKTSSKYGIDNRGLYRMTNVERTLLEALKFAVKIGPRIAINATRKALHDRLTTEKKLGEMASQLKLRSVLEKNWEAIVI